jgi:predicted CXXCH cytochrome family protein
MEVEMMQRARIRNTVLPVLAGLAAGLAGLLFTVGLAQAGPPAAPIRQAVEPADEPLPETVRDCQECHLDVTNHWSRSPHAHAFDDPFFQERYIGLGELPECLVCHTTGYQQSTGEYVAEGIQCQACHGETDSDHPPAPVAIKADTEYCGICHTTTLSEWRVTGHSTAGIGCMGCHDPHSQKPLFEDPDDMCLNCHEDSMGPYLEDLHVQKGIGCVDCHALVIPPEVIPDDGIVPTGHTFTITPATCVACHTDALHAGFSLPGYEHGAAAANGARSVAEAGEPPSEESVTRPEARGELTVEQRIQALEAALASQNISLLFQGGLVGLVLGGSTAWIVAHNVRRGSELQQESEEQGADE